MEVGVLVLTEEPLTGEQRLCCEAYLTFVALGPDRRPRPVPPLLVESELERQRQREASARRAARLELREALRRK
jgi:acyl-CoA hydrolase